MLKQNVCISNTGNPTYFIQVLEVFLPLISVCVSITIPRSKLVSSWWSVRKWPLSSCHNYNALLWPWRSAVVEIRQGWLVHVLGSMCRRADHGKYCGDSSIDSFTEKLIAIAENTIPKSKRRKRTVNTVWCNSECKNWINYSTGWILTVLNSLKPKQSACTSADFGKFTQILCCF